MMLSLYSIFESFHKFLFPLKCLPSRSNSAIYGLIAIQNLSIRIEFILKFTIIYCFDFLGFGSFGEYKIFYFFICSFHNSFPTNTFNLALTSWCFAFFLASYYCLLMEIGVSFFFLFFSKRIKMNKEEKMQKSRVLCID